MNTLRALLLLGSILACHTLSFAQMPSPAEPRKLDLTISVGGTFVLGEPIIASVTIANNTIGDISFDEQHPGTTITFDVRDSDDTNPLPLRQEGKALLAKPFVLPANETLIGDYRIDKLVDLTQVGRYFVTFKATYQGIVYATRVRMVELVPGFVLGEGVQLFSKHPNLQRQFTIVRWPRQHVDCAFLRIVDKPTGRQFETINLGPYLGLNKLKMNIAPNGEITTLHRATPDHYIRHVFWSLPEEVVHRSKIQLVDPNASGGDRLTDLRKYVEGAVNDASDKK